MSTLQTTIPHRPQHQKKVTIENVQPDSPSDLEDVLDDLNY